MELPELQQVWDDWAKADPMWAILSVPEKRGRQWDAEQFFLTGREEIQRVLSDLEARSISLRRGRCLDFGCGLGRLTQALAQNFDAAVGVDISPTMIRQAQEFNAHPANCTYRVNDRPDLSIFPSSSFDFIYSNIVLQHIAPELSENYIREFVRLLTVGGVAVFQVPSTFFETSQLVRLPEGSHRAQVTLKGELPPFVAAARTRLNVEVANASDFPWPVEPNLRLGNHWRSVDGTSLLALDDGRTRLPRALDPGERVSIDITVQAPAKPGSYLLELDMVEEAVAWFGDLGSPTLRLPVRVSRGSIMRHLPKRQTRSVGGGPPVEPRLFEMHALPKDRVLAAIEESGGRLLEAESYNPAGHGWESYRYFVTSDRTAKEVGKELD